MKGMSLMADRGAGGDAGENIGVVLLIGGQDVEMNLHLVHEPLGEERAQVGGRSSGR